MSQALINHTFHSQSGPDEVKAIQKDSFDIFADYSSEKSSSFFKAIFVFIDFFKNVDCLSKDSSLLTISDYSKDIKNIHSPGGFVKAANTLRNSAVKWWQGDEKTPLSRLFRDSLGLFNPVNEFCSLTSKRFFPIAASRLSAISGATGLATAITFTWDTWESFEVLKTPKGKKGANQDKPYTSEQYSEKAIKIAFQVSYVALGTMTFLTSFFGFVFAPLTYSILSVVTVVFGYIEYFHKHHKDTRQLTLI